MFFSLFSRKLSITFLLHAIFFFRQALTGNFFQNRPPHPPPLSRVKWSARKVCAARLPAMRVRHMKCVRKKNKLFYYKSRGSQLCYMELYYIRLHLNLQTKLFQYSSHLQNSPLSFLGKEFNPIQVPLHPGVSRDPHCRLKFLH